MHNEFPVPHEIFENSEFKKLSHRAVRLYCYLAKLKNRYGKKTGVGKGLFFRAIDTLSIDTGMSARAVRYAKKEMKNSGLIEIEKGHYQKGYRGADFFKLNGYVYKKP